MAPIFAHSAHTFAPVGHIVRALLERDPSGVKAYTLNVAGSLGGILGFTLLSFAWTPPLIWIGCAGLLLAVLVIRSPHLLVAAIAAFGIALVIVGTGNSSAGGVRWSPYQKLRLQPAFDGRELTSYQLTTNSSWYQQIVNLSPTFVAKHPADFPFPLDENPYNLPYRFGDARSVLVLGAGMGNDVAAALRNGAQDVVAVEIDPLIVALGKELHFEHPYSDPKVRLVIDDARSYLENAHEQFDLICFSLLDSHTTSSHFSNIRIDNYVYTREALEKARRVLKPQGVVIVKFAVGTPWIAGRIFALLRATFGWDPLEFDTDVVTYGSAGRMYVAGNSLTALRRRLLSDARLLAFIKSHGSVHREPAEETTDDWPYFYQHERGLPLIVIALSAALVLLSVWLVRRVRGVGKAPFSWPLFFLGAGFMLLETQIVSRIALLFGTTWLVNSIAVSGLLALIVLANGVAYLWPRFPLGLAHGALAAAIIVSWLVPTHALLLESPALRGVAATTVLCLPVFFAGIVFMRTFADTGYRGEALGANLVGALAGGVLESLSFWTGLRALLLLALTLYAAAFLTHRFRAITAPAST
jgi:SAM-dependent methyltransferase